LKVGLPPIASPDARLFVLGSLPGDASLAAKRYYAHPTNQFWRLLGGAIGEDLQSMDYEPRLQRLRERQIGLWDVIASAERPGSLDQAIRRPEHNRLAELLEHFPNVQAIAFNGSAAAAIGGKLLAGMASPPHAIALPSSSAANTLKFDLKAQAWSQIAPWAGAKGLHGA
jgi:hypoxanthine-DNA glycosylase